MYPYMYPLNVPRALILLTAYLLLSLGALRLPNKWGMRAGGFLAVNLCLLIMLYRILEHPLPFLAAYIGIVVVFYGLTRFFALKSLWWIPTLAPVILLAVARFIPAGETEDGTIASLSQRLIGLSYLAFRLSQLVVVIRNEVVPMPSILEYGSFAFFTPLMFVGPITGYATFRSSFLAPDRKITPFGRSLLRLLIGLTKYQFIGNILNQLSYSGIILDGLKHPPSDLVVAAVFFYLYLYVNFSGFCDIVIGIAGLIGIKVSENFNEPLKARNVQDYWNRWHMTLSGYMRDMVFTPLNKMLLTKYSMPAKTSTSISIAAVFLLIGIWHGFDVGYFLFGCIHAIGMVVHYHYGLFLKKKLDAEQLQLYDENKWIKAIGITSTFIFVTVSLFFFANGSAEGMKVVFKAIQW